MVIVRDDSHRETELDVLTTWRAAIEAGVPWPVVEALVLQHCESRPEVLREYLIAAETTSSRAGLRLVA